MIYPFVNADSNKFSIKTSTITMGISDVILSMLKD